MNNNHKLLAQIMLFKKHEKDYTKEEAQKIKKELLKDCNKKIVNEMVKLIDFINKL